MKPNISFKLIYGVIFFIALLLFFIFYQNGIINIKIDIISCLLLVIVIAFLFLPLVKEVRILNLISLKKDFEDFKKDVNTKLSIIQNTVITSMNQNQSVNVFYPDVNEKDLKDANKELERKVKKIPSERIRDFKHYTFEDEIEGEDYASQIFKNSVDIERRMNELVKINDILLDHPRGMQYLSRLLLKHKVIDKRLYKSINIFVPLRNRVIHGFELPKNKMKNAIDLSNNVILLLDEILYDHYIGKYVLERKNETRLIEKKGSKKR